MTKPIQLQYNGNTMSRTVLQIPMEPALRKKAEKTAKEGGFSSLQEVVRVFLKQYSNNVVDIHFSSEPEKIGKLTTLNFHSSN